MTGETGPRKVVEQRGLWYEEFETGVLYLHRPGRTITEADNVLFTTLTMNTQALHLDAAFSEAQPPPFHQRLVNSMFTLSTLVGLSVTQLTQAPSSATSDSPRSLPEAAVPRRHALRGIRGRRKARVQEPPGRRDRHVRSYRAQPARRYRRHRIAQDHGPQEASGG